MTLVQFTEKQTNELLANFQFNVNQHINAYNPKYRFLESTMKPYTKTHINLKQTPPKENGTLYKSA